MLFLSCYFSYIARTIAWSFLLLCFLFLRCEFRSKYYFRNVEHPLFLWPLSFRLLLLCFALCLSTLPVHLAVVSAFMYFSMYSTVFLYFVFLAMWSELQLRTTPKIWNVAICPPPPPAPKLKLRLRVGGANFKNLPPQRCFLRWSNFIPPPPPPKLASKRLAHPPNATRNLKNLPPPPKHDSEMG